MPAKTTVKARLPPASAGSARWCSRRPRAIGGCCSSASACRSTPSRRVPTKPRSPARRRRRRRLRLAEAKARSVAGAHPDALVIGSDQVADCDGAPVGKPGTHERARGAAHARSPARPSCSTPASRCSMRRAGLPDRARRRAQHVPVPVADARSRRTCDASGPTIAPAACGRRRSASRFSSASRATIRRR